MNERTIIVVTCITTELLDHLIILHINSFKKKEPPPKIGQEAHLNTH